MPHLVPATVPYEVTFKHSDSNSAQGYRIEKYPVIAWDHDGEPYVMPHGHKYAVQASSLNGYLGATEAPGPVIAVLPGGGWRAEYKDPNGVVWSELVLSWLVRANGESSPQCTDAAGSCDDPATMGDFVRLYHPDMVDPVVTTP